MSSNRKVHYLGTIFASRTACGSDVVLHAANDRSLVTSDQRANVTCVRCSRAMV